MGDCLKGKSETEEKPESYRCHKCGAVSDKKGHLCKPEKIGKSGEKGEHGRKGK